MKLRPHHPPGDGYILVLMQASVPFYHQGLGISGMLPLSKGISHRGQGCSWDPTLLQDGGHRNSQGQVSSFPGVTPFGDSKFGHLFSKLFYSLLATEGHEGPEPLKENDGCSLMILKESSQDH